MKKTVVYTSDKVFELRYYLNNELIKVIKCRAKNKREAEHYYHGDVEKYDLFEIVEL